MKKRNEDKNLHSRIVQEKPNTFFDKKADKKRTKARETVLKMLQKAYCKAQKKGRSDFIVVEVPYMLFIQCNRGIDIYDEGFGKELRQLGWIAEYVPKSTNGKEAHYRISKNSN